MKNLALSLFALLFLTHCQTIDWSGRVTQQGNLLPEKKVNQLKLGMSKQAVASLLGQSLISPLLQANRIDYAYTWHQAGTTDKKKHLELFFTNNRLTSIKRSAAE